jgi:hypothetical protein
MKLREALRFTNHIRYGIAQGIQVYFVRFLLCPQPRFLIADVVTVVVVVNVGIADAATGRATVAARNHFKISQTI